MPLTVITTCMVKKSLSHWLLTRNRKEILALSCITALWTCFVFVIGWFVFQSSVMDAGIPFYKRTVRLLFFGIPAVIAWYAACAAGNELASVLCRHIVKKAVSVKTFLKALGDEDVDSLLNMARQFNLSVYRLPRKLDSAEQENVDCRLEPLFATPLYAFFVRGHYYAKDLLCLDAEQVESVYSKIIQALMLSRPDCIRNQADAHREKQILALQTKLDAAKKKLSEKDLSAGPYKRVANARLAIIAQLAASGFARDVLLREWEEGKSYSGDEINAVYKKALEESNLKPLLNEIKDTGYDELDATTMRIFKAFMPLGTVKWGGDEKRVTPEMAVRSLMMKEERKDKEGRKNLPVEG